MRRALFAITATLLIATRAQEAFGQCSITTLDLNGVPTLCADYGDAWQWNGPGGFTSNAMCVDAVLPGLYTLRAWDATSGTWSDPCSQQVGSPPTAPSCSIVGPDTVCAGGTVTWCAPSGNFIYAWSSPDGFFGTSACVELSTPGVYGVVLTDLTTGAMSEPCIRTLRAVDCAPLKQGQACPGSARWWAANCGQGEHSLDAGRFARVANGVDQRSAALAYGGTPDGLCHLITPNRRGNAHGSALRHYAAVLANVVAGELGVTDAHGKRIGLSPDLVLDGVRGVPAGTTLGTWLGNTEATLVTMSGGSNRGNAARETCRRIRHQARDINAGVPAAGCAGVASALLADLDGDDDEWGMSLSGGALVSNGGPSPFSGDSRLRWTLLRADEVELDVLDLSGRRVKHLANGLYAPGTHDFTWDGRDDDGHALHAGAYFVAGRIGDTRMAQRLILLR